VNWIQNWLNTPTCWLANCRPACDSLIIPCIELIDFSSVFVQHWIQLLWEVYTFRDVIPYRKCLMSAGALLRPQHQLNGFLNYLEDTRGVHMPSDAIPTSCSAPATMFCPQGCSSQLAQRYNAHLSKCTKMIFSLGWHCRLAVPNLFFLVADYYKISPRSCGPPFKNPHVHFRIYFSCAPPTKITTREMYIWVTWICMLKK
jgi:hypothetical protein